MKLKEITAVLLTAPKKLNVGMQLDVCEQIFLKLGMIVDPIIHYKLVLV